MSGYRTTNQSDGVHIEARCTCGEKLEGVGKNESAAMSALLEVFSRYAGISTRVGQAETYPFCYGDGCMLSPLFT